MNFAAGERGGFKHAFEAEGRLFIRFLWEARFFGAVIRGFPTNFFRCAHVSSILLGTPGQHSHGPRRKSEPLHKGEK
jgi:hypothetical protein